MAEPFAGIRVEGLRKRYGRGEAAVDALKGVDMNVAPGEVVGLIGPSGSGKSTLLKCLGAIIEPTSGKMTLGNEVIYDNGWTVKDLRALRRDRIGFVFQAPYLIPFLDVTDNVALLPMLAGLPNAQARSRALDRVRLAGHRRAAAAEPLEAAEGAQRFDPTPLDAAEVAETRRIVQAALERLPADQRETLEMAYFRGMSQTEIAAATGQPLGTVKTRCRLGLQKLREALSVLRDDRA